MVVTNFAEAYIYSDISVLFGGSVSFKRINSDVTTAKV